MCMQSTLDHIEVLKGGIHPHHKSHQLKYKGAKP